MKRFVARAAAGRLRPCRTRWTRRWAGWRRSRCRRWTRGRPCAGGSTRSTSDPVDHGRVTGEAWRFLDETLDELAARRAPQDLAATLATSYRRVTLAASDGGERATIDLDVAMESMADREVALREDMALVETKTDGESGVVDELLASIGCEPTSISKYRLGVGLLVAPDPEAARLEHLRRCFS